MLICSVPVMLTSLLSSCDVCQVSLPPQWSSHFFASVNSKHLVKRDFEALKLYNILFPILISTNNFGIH